MTNIVRIHKDKSSLVIRADPTPAHGQLYLDPGAATGAAQTTVSVQGLAAGSYYLVYQSTNGRITTKGLIN